MNILVCTSEVGNRAGGLAYHSSQLIDIFEKLGHNVSVEVLLDPCDYYVVDGGYDLELGSKIRSAYKLKTMISRYSDAVDLCVSCGAGRTAYYSMLFCKENNIPLYIVLCGSEINVAWDSTKIMHYNIEAFKYASRVIGISKELVDNAIRIGLNSYCEMSVIPIMYNFSQKVQNKECRDKNLTFVIGSNFLGEKKGIANLLYSFSILINEYNRDDKLILFGTIDEDIKTAYIEIINRKKINNNVVFRDYLPREQFVEAISEADVYLQASPFEGFGISVVEALDEGVDILITNTGYIAESIKDMYSEHIIYSLNPREMAKDIYNYVVNVYPKNEAHELKTLLQNRLNEESVLEEWRKVLEGCKRNNVINCKENCICVMFHDVDTMYSGVEYNVNGFERIMEQLFKKGYLLCSAEEYFKAKDKQNLVICTFDDGYENVYEKAFPIMKKYGFTGTVFVCPDLVGKDNSWNHRDEVNRMHMTHDMISKLVEAGWEVGSHGLSHMNMIRLSEHELEECLLESKRLLNKYGDIKTFCYPYGIFNLYIKEKVKDYYERAFSVTIGGSDYMNDLYQITRVTPEELIKELKLY